MKHLGIRDFFKALEIHKPSVEDLLKMTPEERQKYYKEHTWGRGEIDDDPFEFPEPEYDENGNLMIYIDDRWFKGENK